MKPAAQPLDDSLTTEFSQARIDAQDVEYILPLREFLETHGLLVSVNREDGGVPVYHLIAGDAEFVAAYFRKGHTDTKFLYIILGLAGPFTHSTHKNQKVVLADIKQLTAQQVHEVFDFFFTSGKDVLDLRSPELAKLMHRKIIEPKIEPVVREVEAGDRARIGRIMSDVFRDEKTQKKAHAPRSWVWGVLFGLALFVVPFFWYLLSMGIISVSLGVSAKALTQGNVTVVRRGTAVARHWIGQGKLVLGAFGVPLSFGEYGLVRDQERVWSFFESARKAESEVGELLGLAQRVASGLLAQSDVAGSEMTPAADMAELGRLLTSTQNSLGLAQADLSELLSRRVMPFSVPAVWRVGEQLIEKLSDVRSNVTNIDKTVSLFVQASGFREPRVYLVLFQNSLELRPTGGFIGSVGLATFAEGRMQDFAIHDVYTFDGQLKGHVDPPLPIRELLGQEHWYLRDSNWDPDFAETGARAAWFYEKETGHKVDGVIAVNIPFVVDLLAATGPIDLPDYDDRITAENFYGKSLYYTQANFFPGSTQKKDFLGTLARTLIEKITKGNDVNNTQLFHAMTNAFERHDLMFHFVDPELQSLVEHFGWAGKVPAESGCAATGNAYCAFDFLAIVEANLGVNKVNHLISRSIHRDIRVDEFGKIREDVLLTIKNAGSSEDPAAQPYVVYTQFIPSDAVSVDEISLDGVAIGSSGKTVKLPRVLPYIEQSLMASGRSVWGVAIDVPPASEKKILVSLRHEKPLAFGVGGSILDVYDQKQPGVTGAELSVSVSYPLGWTAGVEGGSAKKEGFIAKDGQFQYNTILTRDKFTRIRFTR